MPLRIVLAEFEIISFACSMFCDVFLAFEAQCMIFVCATVTDALTRRMEEKWDTSKVKEELQCDICAHIAKVRDAKLSELAKAYEVSL